MPWHGDGRDGRHDRDRGHDRGGDHHKDAPRGMTNNAQEAAQTRLLLVVKLDMNKEA